MEWVLLSPREAEIQCGVQGHDVSGRSGDNPVLPPCPQAGGQASPGRPAAASKAQRLSLSPAPDRLIGEQGTHASRNQGRFS